MPSILCVGEDPYLLSSRAALVRQLGADVQWSTSAAEASRRISEEAFDILILCHTVSAEDAVTISTIARERGDSPLILLIRQYMDLDEHPSPIPFDAVTDSRPASFTSCVKQLLEWREPGASHHHN